MVNNSNKMNYHLSLLINEHKEKIIAYHVGNPNPGLGQAQKCGGFKTVNRIPNLPSSDTGSPRDSSSLFFYKVENNIS
jgi:hypothetical protein